MPASLIPASIPDRGLPICTMLAPLLSRMQRKTTNCSLETFPPPTNTHPQENLKDETHWNLAAWMMPILKRQGGVRQDHTQRCWRHMGKLSRGKFIRLKVPVPGHSKGGSTRLSSRDRLATGQGGHAWSTRAGNRSVKVTDTKTQLVCLQVGEGKR